MHEFSLVRNVIEICEEQMHSREGKYISQIELEIGTLSGVEMDAFEFAWKTAVPGTLLAHTQRKVLKIEAKAHCKKCNSTFVINEVFDPCPQCGEYFTEIVEGQELRVKNLILGTIAPKPSITNT